MGHKIPYKQRIIRVKTGHFLHVKTSMTGNFRPLRPVRALSHPTNTPQMPSMNGRAHLGWIRNLVSQGDSWMYPTKVPRMVNPLKKALYILYNGYLWVYIPWVYTVREYTQLSLEFF